jgi:DNA invertase Pin-like site-specific DNA recombinase
VRVTVDVADIQYKPSTTRPPGGHRPGIDTLNARIEDLQAELTKLELEKSWIEARAAGHRADFERDLIRERTGEGRKRAMANGVKFGRKRKLGDYQRAEAIKRRDAGETLAVIAKSYGVAISMISRL